MLMTLALRLQLKQRKVALIEGPQGAAWGHALKFRTGSQYKTKKHKVVTGSLTQVNYHDNWLLVVAQMIEFLVFWGFVVESCGRGGPHGPLGPGTRAQPQKGRCGPPCPHGSTNTTPIIKSGQLPIINYSYLLGTGLTTGNQLLVFVSIGSVNLFLGRAKPIIYIQREIF